MPHVRIGRRFVIALLVSLAVHIALGPFVRRVPQAIAEQRAPDVVSIETAEPRRPIPTPRPAPAPRASAANRIAHAAPSEIAPHVLADRPSHRALRAPRAVALAPGMPQERVATGLAPADDPGTDAADRGNGGTQPADDAAPATAGEPSPSETPRPACSAPQTEARATKTTEPETPESALRAGATGTVSVRVDLSETGALLGVSIDRSSGNDALDRAALDAARSSSYAAATVSCRAESGSYLFRVEFDG